MKLSENLEKTTTQETRNINWRECLNQACSTQDLNYRRITKILKELVKKDIPEALQFPEIDLYIIFLSKIPLNLWAEKPVLYYRYEKWDALGLLGERIHRTTIRTKYLELYFRKIGIKITDILDNEHKDYIKYKNSKERFLAALHYAEGKLTNEEMTELYCKARSLSDGKFYYE